MTHVRRARSKIDFQRRYQAYAHNHGMTSEQMLAYDKQFYPDARLSPFLLWCSCKKFEWSSSHPGSDPELHVEFDPWLDSLVPVADVLTCECHEHCRL